jgi:hypothetical protein
MRTFASPSVNNLVNDAIESKYNYIIHTTVCHVDIV